MKKTLFLLLAFCILLVGCATVNGETTTTTAVENTVTVNTTWRYESSVGDGCVIYSANDYMLMDGSTVKYSTDYKSGTNVIVCFYYKDALAFMFKNILPSGNIHSITYAETLEDILNGNFSTYIPTVTDTGMCCLSEKDSKFFYNELALYNTTGHAYFGIRTTTGEILLVNVMCGNFYKYAPYLQ